MDINEASNALKNRLLTISVFGLGKMGLPICTVFLEAEYNVIGVDISPKLVEDLNEGIIPIVGEPGVEEGIAKALENKQFSATLSVSDAVKSSDIIVIIILILVDEKKQPHLDPLKELLEKIGKHLEKGHLIIQETTLPIGTTERIIKPLLEEIQH